MKKLIFASLALGLLMTTSCKKKEEKTSSSGNNNSSGTYYFSGTVDGTAFNYKEDVNDYYLATFWNGIDMIDGDDTTYYENISSTMQRSGEFAPAIGLRNSFETIGKDSAMTLSHHFPIGTFNVGSDEDPEFRLEYTPSQDPDCFICSPEYTSNTLGTVTIDEVTYLGKDEFFGEIAKEYRVKGSVDCYVYASETDSLHVVGEFDMKFTSQHFE